MEVKAFAECPNLGQTLLFRVFQYIVPKWCTVS